MLLTLAATVAVPVARVLAVLLFVPRARVRLRAVVLLTHSLLNANDYSFKTTR